MTKSREERNTSGESREGDTSPEPEAGSARQEREPTERDGLKPWGHPGIATVEDQLRRAGALGISGMLPDWLVHQAQVQIERGGVLAAQDYLRRSEALRIDQILRDSPVLQTQELARINLLRVQERLSHSDAPRIQEILQASPALRMQEQMERSLLNAQQQLRQYGAFKIEPVLRDLPLFSAQEQAERGLLGIQEGFRRSGALGIEEMLPDSAAVQRHEQIERDLFGAQTYLPRAGALGIDQVLQDSSFRQSQKQVERVYLGIQHQLHRMGLLGIESALQGSFAANLLSAVSTIHDPRISLRMWAAGLDVQSFAGETLQVLPDGAVRLGDETASASEVEDAFRAVLEHLPKYLNDVGSTLLQLRKPVQAVLAWFTEHLLLPVLLALYFQQQATLDLQDLQQRFELANATTRREVIDAIKRNRLDDAAVAQGAHCVVTADGVRIRARPSQKAPVIGNMPRGTIVRYLGKRRRWTAVEYIDHGSLERGWVFNKYLRRIDS